MDGWMDFVQSLDGLVTCPNSVLDRLQQPHIKMEEWIIDI